MASQLHNSMGAITISDRVVAEIACSAAMETYGIVGLAARNPKDGLYELLRLENMTKGVMIASHSDSSIAISLSVIIESGVRIAVVAENIIEKIRYQVETRTGLRVRDVQVIVQGIRV